MCWFLEKQIWFYGVVRRSEYVGYGQNEEGRQGLSSPDRRENTDAFATVQGSAQIRFYAVNKNKFGFFLGDVELIEQALNGCAGFDGKIIGRHRHKLLQSGKKLYINLCFHYEAILTLMRAD